MAITDIPFLQWMLSNNVSVQDICCSAKRTFYYRSHVFGTTVALCENVNMYTFFTQSL